MEQGAALRELVVESQQWRLQRQLLVVATAPVPHKQWWPSARAVAYGISGTSQLRYQS